MTNNYEFRFHTNDLIYKYPAALGNRLVLCQQSNYDYFVHFPVDFYLIRTEVNNDFNAGRFINFSIFEPDLLMFEVTEFLSIHLDCIVALNCKWSVVSIYTHTDKTFHHYIAFASLEELLMFKMAL